MSEWIPVTERLPENMPGNSASREVLVTGYMNSDPDDVYVGIDCYYAASGEWLNTDHVLAWMELPKAYLKTAPTVDAEPVKHGRWIYGEDEDGMMVISAKNAVSMLNGITGTITSTSLRNMNTVLIAGRGSTGKDIKKNARVCKNLLLWGLYSL